MLLLNENTSVNLIYSIIQRSRLSLLLFINLLPSTALADLLPPKTIGISQIVEHTALDTVRKSMLLSLKKEGYEEGKNLTVIYENAQGNSVLSMQIAKKLVSLPLDAIVAISTPSAQMTFSVAKKQDKKIPIIFTAISDYIEAGLEATKVSYPITGITDAPHLEGLLEVIEKTLPNSKKVGFIYNPSEANSVSTVKRLKTLLATKGLEVVEVTVNTSCDIPQAVKSLIGKVDLLYFPQDNTVVSALETVTSIAHQATPSLPVILPIYCNDPKIMEGAIVAVGFDYSDIGKETGLVVARLLKGEPIDHIPVKNATKLKIVINKDLINKLGLKIPLKLEFSEIETI